MPCSPEAFLQSAQQILERAEDEATVRAAMSRAYYALYHYGKTFEEKLQPIRRNIPDCFGMHRTLSFKMENQDNFELRKLGQMLQKQHARRVQADYKIDGVIEHGTAEKMLAEISEILSPIHSNHTEK